MRVSSMIVAALSADAFLLRKMANEDTKTKTGEACSKDEQCETGLCAKASTEPKTPNTCIKVPDSSQDDKDCYQAIKDMAVWKAASEDGKTAAHWEVTTERANKQHCETYAGCTYKKDNKKKDGTSIADDKSCTNKPVASCDKVFEGKNWNGNGNANKMSFQKQDVNLKDVQSKTVNNLRNDFKKLCEVTPEKDGPDGSSMSGSF